MASQQAQPESLDFGCGPWQTEDSGLGALPPAPPPRLLSARRLRALIHYVSWIFSGAANRKSFRSGAEALREGRVCPRSWENRNSTYRCSTTIPRAAATTTDPSCYSSPSIVAALKVTKSAA